jgi:hypothetical protein
MARQDAVLRLTQRRHHILAIVKDDRRPGVTMSNVQLFRGARQRRETESREGCESGKYNSQRSLHLILRPKMSNVPDNLRRLGNAKPPAGSSESSTLECHHG